MKEDTRTLDRVLDYMATDLAEQGLKAHLDGKAEASAALYGFSAACQRARIDVLEVEWDAVPARPRGLRRFVSALR